MIQRIAVAIVLTVASSALAQSIEVGRDFYRHGLTAQAKEAFIRLLHDSSAIDADKAKALDWLGQIAFDEGRYGVAMDEWERLVVSYPESDEARQISERLAQLQEVISGTTEENIESAVAASYIRSGDFWNGSDERFTIDSSWLPKDELAIEWYDRVIQEFAGTAAAELAYRKKLFALLGWRDPGQYGNSWGAEKNAQAVLPVLLDTFQSFEREFPDSSYLQGFRYQIAQVYWGERDWENTRTWLNAILEKSGGHESFYTATARARLNKIEY
jgi:tetratricopeptide (TPR) repeat protein